MPIAESIENYFKPEVRSRGQAEFAKELGFISNGSDTQIQGIVKSTPPLRVSLSSASIDSAEINVTCTCRMAGKGSFCKHIWTLLLLAETRHPDFFESKTSLAFGMLAPSADEPYKAKQADFKKQQYEKQKKWVKEKKTENKRKLSEVPRECYSDAVESALIFFAQNGFPMESNRDEELLKNAMKNLARIFHPDKGGSHEEAVILNTHYATLSRFITRN